MSPPLYSVGTWDTDEQAYTPQAGLSVPAFNLTWRQLLVAMRELRNLSYSAHYRRSLTGDHEDNDYCVLIERTDGLSEAKIRQSWKR